MATRTTTRTVHPRQFSLLALLSSSFDGIKPLQFRSRLSAPRISWKVPTPLKNKKIPPVIVVLVLMAVSYYAGGKFSTKSSSATTTDLQAPVAQSIETLNKNFQFSLKDNSGKEISKIKYTITDATLQDEIIVKGQRAHTVAGRTFLILNLKIENPYTKTIQINSRDYVRLSVNGNEKELLAADIHNDPVQIQAISTKPTRLGFPINTTDKYLKLLVGEINGTKEPIQLTLHSK